MMILLSGHSLTAAGKFQPERVSVNLSERGSTATVTLPEGAPALSVGDWVQDEKGPAAGIVWRVRTIDTQYDRETRTVQLEHAINTLRDRVMFGEVKSSDISGSSEDPTAQQAVNYILNCQSDWTLGTFDYGSVTNPYSFNGDDLFSALETVSASLADCVWEYDFSSYPFTISIRQADSNVRSEMRTDRNIRTLKQTVDRSRMYTRFYPIGKNNLHITGEYVSRNENLYGVISKVEADQSLETEAELTAWANERLSRHAEPAVTVTISGLDLAEATGESLDSFVIGKKCRVPLPEYGTTITERVVKLAYSDTVNEPMSVTVTLANELTDVASILREQSRRSGRSGRAGAKAAEEDHAWFVDTTDHVAMVAEAVAGQDSQGNPNWSRVSEIIVSGDGIYSAVTAAESEIVQAQSQIEQNEREIRATVSAAQSQIYTAIQQTASNILAELVDTEEGLTNYINNTASGTRQIIANTTSQIWIQEYDPTTEAGGSHTPKDGDQWVKSTHQGTWDGADGFNWEHDEPFDWYDIQGAQIWGWANNKWELISDQQQVVSYSDVIEAADIYVRRYITAITNDEGLLDVYLSKLSQTATEIRAEVVAANSAQYSYIDQTASNINIGVGNRPTTIMQSKEKDGVPTKVNGRDPKKDDIWIDTENMDTWEDAIDFDWDEEEDLDWNKLRSDRIWVWDGTKWHLAADGTVITEDTDLQVESNHISLLARNIDTLNGYARENFAELRVEASQIRSTVLDKTNQLGSQITQTASQIRSEVWASSSQVYSKISQTASQIRAEVTNEVEGLSSVITQTASAIRLEMTNQVTNLQSSITQTAAEIRLEVSNTTSTVYSNISQTANQIRSEVGNTVSGLQSSITQNANAIGLVVEKKNGVNVIKSASIVSAINGDTSQIKISADKITLDGDTVAASLSGKEVYADAFGGDDLYVYSALHIEEDGDLYYGYGSSAHRYNFSDVIVDASVSGNTLTLTKADGTPVTFNRAISTWVWGGGNGKVNITAYPQNQTKSVNISVDGTPTITANGTYTYKAYFENADGDDVETGASKQITVNVPSSGGAVTLQWDAYPVGDGKSNTIRAMQNGQEVASATIFLNVSTMQNNKSTSKVQAGGVGGTTLCQDDVTGVHSQSVAANVSSIGTSYGGRTYAGAISKSGISANSYLGFAIKCGNQTKEYYISVNS